MNIISSILQFVGDTIGSPPSTLATKSKSIIGAFNEVIADGAGAHNSIYRGKSLGDSVTAEQYEAISSGKFTDLYIGDYWTISGVVYRIAAFDYWLHKGDTECTTHHVLLVPDTCLYNAQMNSSNVTTGGYNGSAMHGSNLASAKTTINAAFGSSHILTHKELLTSAVSGNAPSGWAWYDCTVELLSESMVYGHNGWGSHNGYNTASTMGQLPLFALDESRITNRAIWWLRDVASSTTFALVYNVGHCDDSGASHSYGVRPVFAIKA